MPRLGEVAVNIRANLKPLKQGLAQAKKVVSSAMRAINSVISTAVKWAKRAAVAYIAMHTAATYAAIKQEAAEIELAGALKRSGEYSDEAMADMKAYAASIQEATVYGDEYVLGLIRQAKSLGLTAKQSKEAAKAAISLYEGFGGGRGKPEIFMRYYVEALKGAGSGLATYVNELRLAKTDQEKFAILQKAINEGWGQAKTKAESAGGALSQIKNIIGDTAEVFGKKFLPVFQRLRDWFKENKEAMAMWAERLATVIIGAKNIFWTFLKWLASDFQTNMKNALSATVPLWETLGTSIVKVMKRAWDEIAEYAVWAIKNIRRRTVSKEKIENLAKEIYAASQGGVGGYSPFMTMAEAMKEAEAQLIPKFESTLESWKDVMDGIGEDWKEALDKSWMKLPEELRHDLLKEWVKIRVSLLEIDERYKRQAEQNLKAALDAATGFTTPAAGKKPTRIGTVGIREAWEAMARGLGKPQEDLERKQLTVQTEIAKNTKNIVNRIGEMGMLTS